MFVGLGEVDLVVYGMLCFGFLGLLGAGFGL